MKGHGLESVKVDWLWRKEEREDAKWRSERGRASSRSEYVMARSEKLATMMSGVRLLANVSKRL